MFATIAIDELQVGMHVHLDGGWLSHPFPRSSFRIGSSEQIAIIRGLGLHEVRWVPEKSDLAPPEALTDETPTASSPEPGPTDTAASTAASTGTHTDTDTVQSPTPHDPGPAPVLAAARAAAQAVEVAAQRAALQRCQHQQTLALNACRTTLDAVAQRPAQARAGAAAFAQDLLQQMRVEGDLCIRLLPESGTDRMAAHALNVTVISMLVGRSFGLDDVAMCSLGMGALLHDIGKLDLPERVRHHDARFSPAETAAWREHVAIGLGLGRRLGLSAEVLTVLAQHHEHADGSGFPLHIGGAAMSPLARIVAVVDTYDSLCNPGSTASALTPHEAVQTLYAQGRHRFDAAVLGAFIRMIGVYPAGSLVQLTDDRHALVVAVNSTRPLKPRVLVHDPRVPRDEALVLDLQREQGLGIRRSLPPARVPAAALQYLDPRPRVAYYFEPLAADPELCRVEAEGRHAPGPRMAA